MLIWFGMIDENINYSLAALFGASLSALREQGVLSWQARGVILFSGYGAAQYLGPWLADHLHLTGVGLIGFGFLSGLLGNEMLGMVTDYAHRNMLQKLLSLVKELK